VLRRKFGPKRDEIREGWRKLHNEELHKLYSLPNIVRTISQGGLNGQGILTFTPSSYISS
jgi:hypothetical protein